MSIQPYFVHTCNESFEPKFIIKTARGYNIEYGKKSGFGFHQLLFDLEPKFQPATVGYKGQNIIDSSARKNNIIKDICIEFDKDFDLSDSLSTILPSYFRHYDLKRAINYNDEGEYRCQRKWDLLKYQEGDFFNRHTDGKDNNQDNHYGTLLLFPPKHFCQYTGGDLLFYQSSKQIAKIIPSQFENWTLIGFPINVEHACTQILSGIRYVFKSQINLPPIFQNLFDLDQMSCQPVPVEEQNLREDIEKYQLEIDKSEAKLANLKIKLENTKKGLPNQEILEILKAIKESNKDCCFVIMDRYYERSDPNYLIGQDRLLFNEIIRIYPKTRLGNLSGATHNTGDAGDSEARTELHFPDDIDCRVNCDIIYQSTPNRTATPGRIVNSNSEYNDSTYDTILTTDITVFSVSKK